MKHCLHFSPDSVFEDIEWGTSKVFLQQINRAESLQASISVLPTVLQDVVTIIIDYCKIRNICEGLFFAIFRN